jgi:hypothetical protein
MSIQVHFDKSRDQVIAGLGVKAESVLTLVTHFNPHHDELVAFVLFLQYCTSRFPTLQHVCFDFCKNGEQYRGKDFDANLKDGYLCVGVGGGPLDEHGGVGAARKKNKCSANLLTEYLGIQDLPELQVILEYTKQADLTRIINPLVSANSVKRMYRQGKVFTDTFNMISEETLSILREQKDFFSAAEDYNKAIIERLQIRTKSYAVVSGVSNNPYFAQYARSEFGCQAAVVIQMQSSGNVQIGTNGHYKNLQFENINGLVFLTELKISGYTKPIDWQELKTAEKVAGTDRWYFHKNGGAMLNGSEKFTDVPPTKISMDRLRSIVRIALTPELFAKAMEIISKSALAA